MVIENMVKEIEMYVFISFTKFGGILLKELREKQTRVEFDKRAEGREGHSRSDEITAIIIQGAQLVMTDIGHLTSIIEIANA